MWGIGGSGMVAQGYEGEGRGLESRETAWGIGQGGALVAERSGPPSVPGEASVLQTLALLSRSHPLTLILGGGGV